ncbi:MAG: RecX family transcriptional regulator [Bacteroidetes bacterium]|nr:RecX family transcriptional regulator [Bacteroidota bacterium]
MQTKFKVSKEKALQKIRHFCGYQERCHAEVKEKLYSFGLWKKDVEEILSQLIQESYLNEERFAIQFTGGKFRMKQWGKVKIQYELRQKKISEYCIKKAMKEIDEETYHQTFKKLASKKMTELKSEKNIFIKKRKLQDYLLNKGYEVTLVNQFIHNPNQFTTI